MMEQENGEKVANQLATQVEQLRPRIAATMNASASAEIDVWAPALDPATADLAKVYATASTFARFVDSVHQAPQFAMGYQMAMTEMSSKASKFGIDTEQGSEIDMEAFERLTSAHSGQYL